MDLDDPPPLDLDALRARVASGDYWVPTEEERLQVIEELLREADPLRHWTPPHLSLTAEQIRDLSDSGWFEEAMRLAAIKTDPARDMPPPRIDIDALRARALAGDYPRRGWRFETSMWLLHARFVCREWLRRTR